MKSIRLVVLSGFLVLLSLPCHSQTFMVMSSKGKVEMQQRGEKNTEWKPLKVGDQLQSDDVVRTSFASYVKLMMDQRRLVSIDENTSKKLAEFDTGKEANVGAASGKLLQYAAVQMQRSREGGHRNVYGAVRGEMDMISAVFPKQTVMTVEPDFRWLDPSNEGNYELLLLDDGYAILARLRSDEQYLRYQESDLPKLVHGREYHWRVTRLRDGFESSIESFRILPEDSIVSIRTELSTLDAELADMGADEVSLRLIRAIFFEKKGLLTDAYAEYHQAIRLAPEVEEYRDMLRILLFQLRLYNEEDYLME